MNQQINWVPVLSDSGNITDVCYTMETNTLFVRFRNKKTNALTEYEYYNVPFELGAGILATAGSEHTSTGTYLNLHIKGKFQYKQLA